MDPVRYAESAAGLVNVDLSGSDELRRHLAERPELADRLTDRDVVALRRLQGPLRALFKTSEAGDAGAVVGALNELLGRHPVTPYISDHDRGRLHLHVATQASSVAEQLTSEALLGLAILVCDLGPTRLGVCSAPPCRQVYVDTSPNQSRRYCSDRCSSRANVAAYRARQRAAAG